MAFWSPYRVHYGVFLALVAVVVVWWLIYKTTIGFEIRTVGQNPKAARYAGIRVEKTVVLTMGLLGHLQGWRHNRDTWFEPQICARVWWTGWF